MGALVKAHYVEVLDSPRGFSLTCAGCSLSLVIPGHARAMRAARIHAALPSLASQACVTLAAAEEDGADAVKSAMSAIADR